MADPTQGGGSHGKPKNTAVLAMGGMLAALVFVATYFLKLPMANGYVHLGDGFILLGASLLGYAAIPAAAVGSMLADIPGYAVYALPTFLIKGAVAAVAVVAFKRRRLLLCILWLVLAEAVMVVGYFVVEWLFMGIGIASALASVPGNAMQGLSGVVIALVLSPALRRVKLPGGR